MIQNGVDIVSIDRFKTLIDNDNFLNKYFTKKEIDYINKNINSLAGIFAAKESLLKALKVGMKYPMKDIEVDHDELGAPKFNLYNEIKKDTENYSFSVSISHDGDYAIAITSFIS